MRGMCNTVTGSAKPPPPRSTGPSKCHTHSHGSHVVVVVVVVRLRRIYNQATLSAAPTPRRKRSYVTRVRQPRYVYIYILVLDAYTQYTIICICAYTCGYGRPLFFNRSSSIIQSRRVSVVAREGWGGGGRATYQSLVQVGIFFSRRDKYTPRVSTYIYTIMYNIIIVTMRMYVCIYDGRLFETSPKQIDIYYPSHLPRGDNYK